MLEDEEYGSDSDQSDDDYKPEDRDSEQPSEIDSDGEPENDAADGGTDTKPKGTKRKSIAARNGSNAKRSKVSKEVVQEDNAPETDDEEASKARSDALWADFLNDTDTGTPTTTATTSATSKSMQNNKPKEAIVTRAKYQDEPVAKKETAPAQKTTVKEIFEFAGEKIEVEKEIEIEAKKGDSKIIAGPAAPASRARTGGGLSSVLGQLGKKNKLSVLEKTKMDWTGFKKNEGIEDELHVHNKGRDGYLERQDFLERTDFRRFEIEKSLRQVTRRK